jgi:hypothetical protein
MFRKRQSVMPLARSNLSFVSKDGRLLRADAFSEILAQGQSLAAISATMSRLSGGCRFEGDMIRDWIPA